MICSQMKERNYKHLNFNVTQLANYLQSGFKNQQIHKYQHENQNLLV